MSIIETNVWYLGIASDRIDKVNAIYEGTVSDYSAIKDRLCNIDDNSGNISLAVDEINSKICDYRDKIDSINGLKSEIHDFLTCLEETEKRVSEKICTSTESFAYTMGIKLPKRHSDKSFFEKIGDEFQDIYDNIAGTIKYGVDEVIDWYDENIDVIFAFANVIVDVAVCAVSIFAIAATVALFPVGTAVTIAGLIEITILGWQAAESVGDLFSSSMAIGLYLDGDKEEGDKWANIDFEDEMAAIGEIVGLKDDFEYVYDVMNFVSTIYDIKDLTESAYDAFKNVKWSDLTKANWFDKDKGLRDFFKRLIGIPVKAKDKSNWGTYIDLVLNTDLDIKKLIKIKKFENVIKISDILVDTITDIRKDGFNIDSLTGENPFISDIDDIFSSGYKIVR